MPIFENITNADLILPQENGSPWGFKVKPGDTFNGSKALYEQYVGSPDYLLERSIDGFIANDAVIATGPDTLTCNVNGFIRPDSIDATDEDAANNTVVTSGNFYSAFGKVRWTDSASGTEYTADFSITGNGDHGGVNEATFSTGIPFPGGSGQEPTEIGSRIDCGSGEIIFAMTGPGAIFPEVEVIYEIALSGEKTGDFDQPVNKPAYTTTYTYVHVADEGSERYVAGSAGQVKTSKIFYSGSKVGDQAKTTTYFYGDTTYPTKSTSKVEEKTLVTLADLP